MSHDDIPNRPMDTTGLWPELSPEQRAEAEYTLGRYFALAFKIWKRIEMEKLRAERKLASLPDEE